MEAAVLALLVFLVIQGTVRNFRVDGSSMHPTLEGGQYLLVNKLVYFKVDKERLSRIVPFWKVDQPDGRFAIHPPERGEVIVFHFPNNPSKDFVKRVIALPGEEVSLRAGTVYINGEPLEETWQPAKDSSTRPPLRVPEKEYYVLGDNRKASNDSRNWGFVSEEEVVGKVWLVYWPTSSARWLNSTASAVRELFR
ncbi:MAG: signal peptidase I [Dehalococcoidia bacterium]|nr:signal peptidase I [Dehalococcoidia bacterium]